MSQSQLEALSLKDSQLPKVKVHATAIFSILNHFIRRTPREGRVMGTLLGEVKEDGTVEITDCFAVPFTEKVEEHYVAIDQKYHTLMYAFHRRNNKKEKALGWYTSTTGQGQFIIDTSSLIQDFYSSECANPVHLVVDTTLMGDNMGIRAFLSNQVVVGDEVLANAFQEVVVELAFTEPEASCLYHMIHHQENSAKWADSAVVSRLPSSTTRVGEGLQQLQRVLDSVSAYVDAVVEGRTAPSREIGSAIAEALGAFAAQSRAAGSDSLAGLNGRAQDLLMVSYITTLTQTQLMIAEKLNQIL
ncbi:JAB1/Mov34/MPN/PAD-1 ubiquitin protease-domain-containing protein [Ochromonadaceae sp. CCMP2298]|nr:JAB1/Mov34/MPN/PAD-1 ubiquitin protease-domain-containing protein [Ochromonadaceae sp. CCMP2298]|mmetsp:Transcript_20105/g.44697  ORF Transcript_20105/g.44697 Transcript_20105/m.44697 type:complete len:302 (-) Transcript_20105:196-1101(-)|eukprot:CAMPEP_0173193674 /NCGR_PEP_ID=MMETSP1141-20130122/14080_1 /TAXON_ID=483371 /ORGANISM="non described non described, Strain CCMP2298" /LENGTH=301 /DNA_ID=CAMNT_0014118017 /DNA_START=127 /DNA_END=1032 /DNA_ORIENTATION=-